VTKPALKKKDFSLDGPKLSMILPIILTKKTTNIKEYQKLFVRTENFFEAYK
jgi:hypothetical protein